MNDFFNTFSDFFNALTNEQKIFLGILSLLVFAIGIIVGWILQGTKTRRYKKEMLVLRKDRDEYERLYRTADTQQKALAKELEAVSREKVDALDQIQGLRADLTQRDNAMVPLQGRIEELEASNQSYAATIESLNDQVIGLKTQNEQLVQQGVQVGAAAGAGGGFEAGSSTVQPPSTTAPSGDFNAYMAANDQRFQYLEERLLSLAEENASLRSGNAAPQEQPSLSPGHQPVVPPAVKTDANGEPLMIRADITEPGARTGDGGATEVVVQTSPGVQVPSSLDAGSAEGYDDLTRIRDIGPFLQAKLHEQDITRYEQIANWTEADIVTYTGLIGYLPGIIQRDDWPAQARALMSGETTEPQPYITPAEPEPYAGEENASTDDLRLIEGIGPKIESILRASGIATFEQLANADVDYLRGILAEAGSRFKAHNPKTWPAQAGLAADGKMKELKAWQKELGR